MLKHKNRSLDRIIWWPPEVRYIMLWFHGAGWSRRDLCKGFGRRRAPRRFRRRWIAWFILGLNTERRGWWKTEAEEQQHGIELAKSISPQRICKKRTKSNNFLKRKASILLPQLVFNTSWMRAGEKPNKQPNRPWCQEGVCWSRSERLELEGWQAIGSLEGETLGSKGWIFNRFHSRDVVCLNFIHLGARCQAWGTRFFLLYLQLLMIRFQQRTERLLFTSDSHTLSMWKLTDMLTLGTAGWTTFFTGSIY